MGKIKSYSNFVKFRLSILVLVSALSGYLFAGGSDIITIIYLLTGGFFITAASNGSNQIWERDLDKLMDRTKNRPLPTNKMSLNEAYLVVLICFSLGIFILYLINLYSALLGLAAFVSYVFLYTPLKRKSWLNTSIGAIPGALPPLGGWTAATGSLEWGGIAVFLILFFWQHPHFYSIAYLYKEDYKNAGLEMLPVIDVGVKRTVLHIFLHALVLIPISTLPFFFGVSGRVYFVGAYILSNIYMLLCLPSRANSSLKWTIKYLPCLCSMWQD